MNRLFSLYILVFFCSLTFIINGSRALATEKENTVFSSVEQLSEADTRVYVSKNFTSLRQPGADEGVTVPQGRRFGLNKLPKSHVPFRNYIHEGKSKPMRLSFTGEKRHYIQYLTIRHSQGFYIYSLKELLL